MGTNLVTSRRRFFGLLTATTAAAAAARRGEAVPGDRSGGYSAFKTIGVLGGVGPQATMDFEARVHRVAQRALPRRLNSGYPPLVVYYLRHPPLLVDSEARPLLPHRPHPGLLEAATRLGAWSDFLVITSNGVHLFQDDIERASGKKVLSMVGLVLDEIGRRGYRHVGVLGLGEPVVYSRPLAAAGVRVETIDADLRARLDAEIMKVMEGNDTADSRAHAVEAVETLCRRGVDVVILGCTEIPLLLGEGAKATALIDPLDLLAEAAVRNASAA